MSTALETGSGTGLKPVVIDGDSLGIEDVIQVARHGKPVELSPDGRKKIARSWETLRSLIDSNRVIYGVSTGFGKLSNVLISPEQSRQLQINLIMSHSCGVGKPFPEEVVRAIMLLRANTLCKGFSGVGPYVVETLIRMLNRGVHPVIPEKGSLGASGDLAPLAHTALVMIGLGEAFYRGRRMTGRQAMKIAGIPLVNLEGKDGLGLINGTQVMTALGALWVDEAEALAKTADIAAALTFEALAGLPQALDPRVHELRPHPGQRACAAFLRAMLEGSTYAGRSGRVQDAYSLRCVPQVHGASMDAINYVKGVIRTEINSVTDNPLVFPEEGDVVSGGNFHGQPLAIALDLLAIAASELANISERRIERLLNPQLSGLPPFLSPRSGLNSGLMIAQYTAAALVSENKVLASPASVDSIPTSANQEDHVSMGSIAARKAGEVLENLRHVLAIELLCAAQAIDLQEPGVLGRGTSAAYRAVRTAVPRLDGDRVLSPDIRKLAKLLSTRELLNKVTGALQESGQCGFDSCNY
ncbi:MAG: histidine ammonia-lyase [Peptococcaceae bacterium]|nr:histidine ammonia-lyase [Peptococcaceae bacterium]